MTYLDLHRKLRDQPFKPFRLKVVNNTAIEVLEPGMVIIGESSAVVPTETHLDDRGVRVATHWKTISIAHIIEFEDLKTRNGKKR